MSKSQTRYARGNDWPTLEPMSDMEKRERVQRLPAPVPGVVVTVPLMLWPLYMQLHGLEPKLYQRPVLIVKKQES